MKFYWSKSRFVSLIVFLSFISGLLIGCPPSTTPSFRLELSSSLTIAHTEEKKLTVTVIPLNGFNSIVGLSVENVPTGVTATFSSPDTSTTSELMVKVSDVAKIGDYPVTVKGIAGTNAVTQTLALAIKPKVVPGKGNLQVDISGLPGPWSSEGDVTVVGPNGYNETLYSEATLSTLEPGIYTVIGNPLPICYKTYVAPLARVEVVASEARVANIVYSSSQVTIQGFRGNVVGASTDSSAIRGSTNFIIRNNRLYAYGCVQRLGGGSALNLSNVALFEGNAKEDFVKPRRRAIDFKTLENLTKCTPDFCEGFIYGSPELITEQIEKLNTGQYYLAMNVTSASERVSGQIMPGGLSLPTDMGGDLQIDVNVDELPTYLWQSKVDICIRGYFDLKQTPQDRLGACTSGLNSRLFENIYSGTYETGTPETMHLDNIVDTSVQPNMVYVPIVESSPAEVTVGTRQTITVTYRAAN